VVPVKARPATVAVRGMSNASPARAPLRSCAAPVALRNFASRSSPTASASPLSDAVGGHPLLRRHVFRRRRPSASEQSIVRPHAELVEGAPREGVERERPQSIVTRSPRMAREP
jgi:hypothetical protein